MRRSLAGVWRAEFEDFAGDITIPGTLDESGIGHEDAGTDTCHPDQAPGGATRGSGPIATRLTRRHTYEGPVRLTRRLDEAIPDGARAFIEVARGRCLRLFIDGREAPPFEPPTLSTPQVFEVTGLVHPGAELALISDNSYPGLPRADIVNASAATDETQTNWNGLLGDVCLRLERPVFVRALRVYPRVGALDVRVDLSAARAYRGTIHFICDAVEAGAALRADVPAGEHELRATLPLLPGVRLWDEGDGQRYEMTAAPEGCEAKTICFGIRRFGDDGTGRLALNGRRVFLRGETNCAVFPETGHPPMNVGAWTEILEAYRAYGVNLVRFHSWCPPEAAFEAADRLGMLMQPELSHWNPRDALEDDAAFEYYRRELLQILRACANHPSFVMLTLGNELATGPLGHRRMDELLALAREADDTRLYANGSNVHYGERGCDEQSDFYTASTWYGAPLRGIMSGTDESDGRLQGHINERYPSAAVSYDNVLARLRQAYAGPVFGFEVGQFEVLPDFGELDAFRGVTDPANLRLVQSRVARSGLTGVWRDCVEATGELALLCYREEVEAVLRTPGMSGLALLSLQDFPGQGTALVGMLNSHLRPKPYGFARPERFAAFFRDTLPLARLERYTWLNSETLRVKVLVANYGKAHIPGPLRWRLEGEGYDRSGILAAEAFPPGGLTPAGMLEAPLASISRPVRLELTLAAGEAVNRYPIWVYPDGAAACPGDVVAVDGPGEALAALAAGKKVFLDPPMAAPLRAVPCHFSTDFWSVGTFPCQSGTMGQLIDAAHPIFQGFPTEKHTNWQWWPMAGRRAVHMPAGLRAIVTELDSFATLRPLAQLFECRVGPGRLMFSSMALRQLGQYPEARALLSAIYRYMETDRFQPDQFLDPADLKRMFDG